MSIISKIWNSDIQNRVIAGLITAFIIAIITFFVTTVSIYAKSLYSNEEFMTSVYGFLNWKLPSWLFLVLLASALISFLIQKNNSSINIQKVISEREKLKKEMFTTNTELENARQATNVIKNELENLQEETLKKTKIAKELLDYSKAESENLRVKKNRIKEAAELITKNYTEELKEVKMEAEKKTQQFREKLKTAKNEIATLKQDLIKAEEDIFEYDEDTLKLDRKLFNRIRTEIFVDGFVIEVLKRQSFTSPFKLDDLKDLRKIEQEYTNPEFEFLNPELEEIKNKLVIRILEFETLLRTNTFQNRNGYQALSDEWKTSSPEVLIKVKNQIHETQNKICNHYDNLIRLGRRILKI